MKKFFMSKDKKQINFKDFYDINKAEFNELAINSYIEIKNKKKFFFNFNKYTDKYKVFFSNLDKFYNQNKYLLYYNFYKYLLNKYLFEDKNIDILSKMTNIHKFIFFINILNNITENIISKIIDRITIQKINSDSFKGKKIYLFNINKYNKLIVQTFNNKDYNINIENYNYNYLLNEIETINQFTEKEENKIGNITDASFYSINYSEIDTNMNDIIICILFSNENTYNNQLVEKLRENIYNLLINNIDGIDGSSNIYFKKILLLINIFIDNVILKRKTGGSSIKKSYQLYMNDKNKYYISYNNKNIYLNKNNTYKKKNKLYLKINNETEVIIKT